MSSRLDPWLHHRIEFEAGTSNSIILSKFEANAANELLYETEHEIDAVDLQIAELFRQRDCHIARLERLRAAVAPHKRTPPEILTCIFRNICEDGVVRVPKFLELWAVRHVCSKWRSIAINDHELWNDVAVNIAPGDWYIENDQLKDLIRSERILDVMLPKTGSINFSLSIYGFMSFIQNAMDKLIKPYSDRIIHLHLTLPMISTSLLSDMFQTQFGALESLVLDFTTGLPVVTFSLRKLPPNVRSFSISGERSILSWFRSSELDWGSIIYLDISRVRGLRSFEVLPILQRCINLEICDFRVIDNDNISHTDHVILRHLHSLIISLENSSIFDSFTLPSLTTLTCSYGCSLVPIASITSLVHRSSCAIEALEMRSMTGMITRCDPHDLGPLLATPSLRSFVAGCVVLPVAILEKISQHVLLPRLQVLECRVNKETKLAFLDAVESRLQRSMAGSGVLVPRLHHAVGVYPEQFDPEEGFKSSFMRVGILRGLYGLDTIKFAPYP